MNVPHNAFIMVADGRKLLFLRNEGDGLYVKLNVEKKLVEQNPPTNEQATDLAGRPQSLRTPGANWTSGGNVDNTDFHQLEEDRFAAEAARLLKARALRDDFESLIVVAPPRTLGELRKHYHKEVTQRLRAEIDKDLTGHTVPQIEEALLKAE